MPTPKGTSVRAALALAFCLGCAPHAGAQPSATDTNRVVRSYVYLTNAGSDKVLVSTQFWRNDAKYDDRAFHRFLDTLAALEKRGFHLDEKATIDDWEKPEPFVRCYIYLEDLQAARKGGTTPSGSRVWCSDNGASEHELSGSDTPKHLDQLMASFDAYFNRAKKNVHHRG